jgi:hypothetical protein
VSCGRARMLTVCASDQLPLHHSFSNLAVVVFGCVLVEARNSTIPSEIVLVAMVVPKSGDEAVFAQEQNATFVAMQNLTFALKTLSTEPCRLAIGIVTRVSCPLARPVNTSLTLAITAASQHGWLTHVRLERSQLDGSYQRRKLVWVGTPLFDPGTREDPTALSSARADAWMRARHWVAAWQAAGFAHVHVLGRSAEICAAFLQWAPAGCMCSVCAEHAAYTTQHQTHKDQIAYNNVGLALAQAARYGVVAFVDMDERPGNFGLARAVESELRQKQLPYFLAYMRVSYCSACPTPATHNNLCHPMAKVLGKTKPIAVPHRLQWVSVHGASARQRTKSDPHHTWHATGWSTCLLHPIPIMRAKWERSAARRLWWSGNASGWQEHAPNAWLTDFEVKTGSELEHRNEAGVPGRKAPPPRPP